MKEVSLTHKLLLLLFGMQIALALIVTGAYLNLNESGMDYESRFYKEGLSDYLLVQLYMYPFNSSDVVTLEFGGEHQEIIYINHTVPNPTYTPFKEVYNYIMHFDREFTIEEAD